MRVALLGIAALMLGACGGGSDRSTGNAGDRRFPATGFDRVTLAGPDDIAVAIGPAFRVEAAGDDAVLDRLQISVTDGELRVARESVASGWFAWARRERAATVRITLPLLRGVTVAGAGNAQVEGARAPVFVGAVEGAGGLAVRGLDARNAAFKLSGAGNLSLEGRAGDVTMDVSGAGSIAAEGLDARDLTVTVAGVGNVGARASGRAQVRLSGVGSVEVKGTDNCEISTSGVGNVTCAK